MVGGFLELEMKRTVRRENTVSSAAGRTYRSVRDQTEAAQVPRGISVTFVTVVTDGDDSGRNDTQRNPIDGFNVYEFTGVHLKYRSPYILVRRCK